MNIQPRKIVIDKPSFTFWSFFALLLIIEFLLFRTFLCREVINVYPINYDQTVYLSNSYTLYENILQHGLIKAIYHQNYGDTSFLFPIQAAIFFLFAGASRFSGLLINFLYFCLLQFVIVKLANEITRGYLASIIFSGFLLTLAFTFPLDGGIADFRIDFIAFCLYGIFVITILKSNTFYNRKWTIIAAFVAIFLMLMRYITCVYIATLTLSLMLLFLSILLLKKNYYFKNKIIKRLKNITLFSGIIIVLATPFLWLSRKGIYNHYIVGTVTGSEKYIRAKEQGVTDLIKNLFFYPTSAFHLMGSKTVIYIIVLFAITFIYYFYKKSTSNTTLLSTKKNSLNFILAITSIIFSIVIPLIVLTLDLSKSPIVGGIVVIPFLILVLIIWCNVYKKISSKNEMVSIFYFLAGFLILSGIFNWFNYFGQHSVLFGRDTSQIIKMDVDIGNYAETMGWNKINVAADQTVDFLSVPLSTDYYEHTHQILNVVLNPLGITIFALTPKEAINDLNESDVFITKLGEYPPSPYPSNQDLVAIRPLLQKIAAQKFIKLNDYYIDDSFYRVYVRPDFQIYGLSNDWITSQGILLTLPFKLIKNISAISLSGKINSQWIGKNLKVYACGYKKNKVIPLHATITINNNNYTIYCQLPKNLPINPDHIQLTFSKYFIPKNLGLNDDTRQLVISSPYKKQIILTKLASSSENSS